MKFCIECGKKINSSVKFCTSCGTPVSSQDEKDFNEEDSFITTEEAGQMDETNRHRTDNVKKKGSKKTKVLLGIVIGLALLLFIAHKGLTNYFDPMKSLVAMDKAISDNESAVFLSFITFEDGAIIDKKSYFDYIKEMEWDESTKEQLKNYLENNRKNPSPLDKEIASITGDPLFKVKQKPRLLGLYKEYILHAVPTKLKMYTNVDETEVMIKDTSITIDEIDEHIEVGKIYPGEYTVEATANGEYGNFSYEDTVEVYAVAEDDVEIYFDHFMYEIYTDYGFEDAILFIDNKNSETKIGEVFELGPISDDSNLKLFAEWKDEKGNVVRSNSVQLKDLDEYTDVYFEFDVTKAIPAKIAEQKGAEAGQFVLEFRDAYENAVNYAEFSEIEDFLKVDDHAYNELKKFIKDMEDGYYYYVFDENTITKIKEKDDNVFEVETNELFTFVDDDGKVYEYDRDKKYIVEKVDEDYKIKKIEYTDTEKSNVG